MRSKDGEAHQGFMMKNKCLHFYPHEISRGNWNFARNGGTAYDTLYSLVIYYQL